ncbi:hypothetical protein ASPZODRAFT_87395 [Penicilliopsis zonata CBS 506.65]|uniref:Postreplication repair E3 ubiquitin-protein ligase RAD18 n=1 Tax=Penicilliopsis zonata CBS 506.65 TaxID=1073090 RepID=A0A1L9SVX3_9EURO|nr:hypothetical protein ASPZODRAFT_87395 [Penicilliopsis zonata CBS 506.65]OJJ51251.1 hypothetical protein ASPZODRAFT_87395 [Penicilliopsis zonata CBS 506.65]
MDPSFDLPDSTDWLNTPLSLLAPLESSLRCQVCKDFFNNPVITSCSHTFCSLCIRRCLSKEGKCPACRTSDQELKLRRNWAVQEFVEAFTNARPGVLDLAKKAARGDVGLEQPASKKRKVEHGEDRESDSVGADGVRTRSRSRRLDPQPETGIVEAVEDSQDEDFIPEDGLVACPICNKRMKNEAVFRHLDACTGSASPNKSRNLGPLQVSQTSRSPGNNTTEKPPGRLPTLNYSILKEGVLRRKLRDLGIPDWGAKQLLQKRHTEWMNLWNANCDSKTPKSMKDLLRELDIWERTQGGHAAAASAFAPPSVMRKEFDKEAWSATHDDDFKRLIAKARKKSEEQVRTTIPKMEELPSESSKAAADGPVTNGDKPESPRLPSAFLGPAEVASNSAPSLGPSPNPEM